MATRPFFGICLVVMLLLSGCASHRHTVADGGVRLYLRHRSATSVVLCCSLDGFRAHVATRAPGGIWDVGLPSGTAFSYFYIVDDTVLVPSCDLSEDDGFGGRNCLFDPDM